MLCFFRQSGVRGVKKSRSGIALDSSAHGPPTLRIDGRNGRSHFSISVLWIPLRTVISGPGPLPRAPPRPGKRGLHSPHAIPRRASPPHNLARAAPGGLRTRSRARDGPSAPRRRAGGVDPGRLRAGVPGRARGALGHRAVRFQRARLFRPGRAGHRQGARASAGLSRAPGSSGEILGEDNGGGRHAQAALGADYLLKANLASLFAGRGAPRSTRTRRVSRARRPTSNWRNRASACASSRRLSRPAWTTSAPRSRARSMTMSADRSPH